MCFVNKYIEFEKIAFSLKPTLASNRITAYIFTVFFLCPALISAQPSDTTSDRSTFNLQINQDNSFNFFPVVSRTIPLKKHDLTFYAIFWTSPAFTNPDGSGSLIEAGVGMGFTKGNWYINPYLGFTHGMFTNGRDQNGQGRPSLSEAIVPGIITFMKNEKLEAEIFCSLYKNLRKEVLPVTNYLFCWILPGIRWGKYFSSGLHYEQFIDISGDVAVYSRYGIYGKVTFKDKYDLRLSGGLNYSPDGAGNKVQGDFYKLTVNIPF